VRKIVNKETDNNVIFAFLSLSVFLVYRNKSKGKEIPIHTWTGPEVYRRLKLPYFHTDGTLRW
jgi:hypothetical protein